MKVLRNEKVGMLLNGSYKVGSINNITYNELCNILGKPTYSLPSGDGKTQVEWVIEINDNVFSIYDWKTYDKKFTINELKIWSIGGTTDPKELINYINERK
jgi:hypothetical protein